MSKELHPYLMGAAVIGAERRFADAAYAERAAMSSWCNAVNSEGADVPRAKGAYEQRNVEADRAFEELREIRAANDALARGPQ